ncbi:hypothetical protein Scep_030657 [Stephania cephalantha]|uniref:Cation efflux protein cytoplasmic domain-containing protein n=1 Tax=Stephania cephalantha TaxID=152367 RepID=A0AAP0E068_9MAGN
MHYTLINPYRSRLYRITKRAGEKEGSGLMKANAWHHRADAVSSVVALIGVGGSILGIKLLDPLAGLVVSGMILKAGIQNGYERCGCHRLRGRRAGSSLYLDVHIEVDPFLSVSAAHDIGESVRGQIQKSHSEVAEVFIHIDPAVSKLPHNIPERQEHSEGMGCHKLNAFTEQKEIEALVDCVVSSKFSKKMSVERITHHVLQGKLLLQIEVSMPPDMLIRDAIDLAKQAEEELLRAAASSVSQINIQLRLGQPMPQLGGTPKD